MYIYIYIYIFLMLDGRRDEVRRVGDHQAGPAPQGADRAAEGPICVYIYMDKAIC